MSDTHRTTDGLSRAIIRALCNAYESGFGRGQSGRDLAQPYKPGSPDAMAYSEGWAEGSRRRLPPEPTGFGAEPAGFDSEPTGSAAKPTGFGAEPRGEYETEAEFRERQKKLLWALQQPGEAVEVLAEEVSRQQRRIVGLIANAPEPSGLQKDGVSPAHDACVDIFKDFDASELKQYARSIGFAWEVGRQIEERRSPTKGEKRGS